MTEGLKFAAIDIGSNAMRLLFCRVLNNDKTTTYIKESLIRMPLRLGEDAFSIGEISPKNEKRLIKTIKAFSLMIEAHNPISYKSCATAALRSAKNGNKIVKKINKKTNANLKIITGDEEARLIMSNHIEKHLDIKKHYIYIDVGGGSTEVIIYKNNKLHKSKSFKIGGVRLLNDLVNEESWDEFKHWLLENASEIKKIKLVGIGGNINKIFKLSGNKYGKPLSRSKFKSTLKKLKKTSTKKMLLDLKLNPDRIDVILPAGKIYYFLMKTLSIEKIYVPKIGLADGMVKKIINSKIKF